LAYLLIVPRDLFSVRSRPHLALYRFPDDRLVSAAAPTGSV
jgi:hypothetical protein